MQTPNSTGVYEAEFVDEVARIGRLKATLSICQCEDGLFRHTIAIEYGIGGFSGPITKAVVGHQSEAAARTAALKELLQRCPTPQPSYPQDINEDLPLFLQMLFDKLRQPSLFDLVT